MLRGPWHSVFTDVAWNSSTEEAGLGWIMDDEISASQYSATSTHVTSLLLQETLAVLAAMDFALSHGYTFYFSVVSLGTSKDLVTFQDSLVLNGTSLKGLFKFSNWQMLPENIVSTDTSSPHQTIIDYSKGREAEIQRALALQHALDEKIMGF
ncbi:hypothetical protein F2Q69_00039176 [Brassica cretica]|uniref:RNase H type-1 domain-containing protein n=1 Tax=Brassica cretica TaxID=69181 RepID=A0A8S9SQV0_BRACR|nr:hypothetical protein F2Q69_00039176 [Brassica cretica]